MTASMVLRLFGVVEAGDLGRAHQQAAVVGGQLEAGQRRRLQLRRGQLFDARRVLQQHVDDVAHGHVVGERPPEDVGHAGGQRLVAAELVAGGRQTVEAGGAGRHHFVGALLGRQRQVARRQRHAEGVIGRVGRAGAAAGPVVDLAHLDAEGVGHGAEALVELARGAVQRAARVVGERHSRSPPAAGVGSPRVARGSRHSRPASPAGSSQSLKMRRTFSMSRMRSGRGCSLPRLSMPGALLASASSAPLRSL